MKHDYSLLLIGHLYDNHMVRFVKNLKKENPEAQIDAFIVKEKDRCLDEDYLSCYRECYIADFSRVFKKVPGIKSIELLCNLKYYFKKFSRDRHYDIVNIQFPSYYQNYILNDIKNIAGRIVLTPWGSDVYRISDTKRKFLKRVYDEADFVTGHGDRFTKDFMQIFDIPQHKIASADIGSDTIDYIIDHRELVSTIDAKRSLHLENKYVITCGYNASPAQQHSIIVKAISIIKEKLGDNIVLLFPMTYPKNKGYVGQIKQEVEKSGLEGVFFEEYLDMDKLFLVRQATDMFIHVQTTDANCASIKEYLILRKNIVNGSWLEYDEFEKDGQCPYYKVDNMNNLSNIILYAYMNGPVEIAESVVNQAEKSGWKNAVKEWNSLFEELA